MNEAPWQDPKFDRQTYAIEMALRYVWSSQRQINRFIEGFVTRPPRMHDLTRGILPPVDVHRTCDLYRSDAYLTLMVVRQAARWLDAAERELGTPPGTLRHAVLQKQVKDLRDVYEHWNEQVDDFRQGAPKSGSGVAFRAANPTLDWPGDGWVWTPEDGASLDNLRLRDVFAELTRPLRRMPGSRARPGPRFGFQVFSMAAQITSFESRRSATMAGCSGSSSSNGCAMLQGWPPKRTPR